MKDMAYQDPAGFALNVLPLAAVGRAAALGRIGKLADGAEAGARAEAAGNTAKAARLSEQAARYRQAISLARGGKAGAAVREAKARAAAKLSAGAKTKLAKAQAAVKKRQEGRRNAERMASPGKLKERWRNQVGGRGSGQDQPALAGVSGGEGGGTAAIGRPGGKSGMTQMAQGELESGAIARRPPVKPTGEAKGKPSGIPESVEADTPAQQAHDIRRQNEAADALAYHGYRVEHKSPVVPSDNLKPTRDPDYRIEGRIFDGYAPGKSTSLESVRDFMSKKVKNGQTNSLLLNLTDSNLSADEIRTMLTERKPILGKQYGPLDQVVAVRPKPGAVPITEGSTPVYKPEDMDIFNIFP